MKRQQAVEDAIALRLASNESGKSLEALPPGKIFGMKVTEPKIEVQSQIESEEVCRKTSTSTTTLSITSPSIQSPPTGGVSQNAIEMLSTLFPHRKRSVLELVLRRCDLDLLK